jgi:hypothetical protein
MTTSSFVTMKASSSMIDAVKGEVVESSREIMGELALQGRFDDGVFVIEDSDGRRVLQFPLKGALWG